MSFSVVWKVEVFEAIFFKPKICVLPCPNVLCIRKKMTYETENYEKGITQRSIDTGKENYITDSLIVAAVPYLRDLHLSTWMLPKSQRKLSGLKVSFSSKLHIFWPTVLVKKYSCSVLLWSSCWHVFISFNIWNYCNFTFMYCIKGCWRQWRIYHSLWLRERGLH